MVPQVQSPQHLPQDESPLPPQIPDMIGSKSETRAAALPRAYTLFTTFFKLVSYCPTKGQLLASLPALMALSLVRTVLSLVVAIT